MKARNRSLLTGVLAAVLAVQPLAAAPVIAQESRQTLNVQNADIRAFVQDVARTTGRTFIVDPAVTGTVTVSSPRPRPAPNCSRSSCRRCGPMVWW